MIDPEREKELFAAAGLNPEVAARQVARVRAFREGKGSAYFKVLEPATPKNRGIMVLGERERKRLAPRAEEFLSRGLLLGVVLAAGESRRYLKSPNLFYEALRAKERGEHELSKRIFEEIEAKEGEIVPRGLRPGELEDQPFYRLIPKEILQDPARVVRFIMGPGGLGCAELPKALLHGALLRGEPATYFELKLLEAKALNPTGRVLFIIQKKHLGLFEEASARAAARFGLEPGRVIFDFQAARHATVRIDKATGEVAMTEDRGAAVGMGGHGEIARDLNRILPEMREEAILLTNVDNLIGAGPRRLAEQKAALGLFLELRDDAARLEGALSVPNPGEDDLEHAKRLLEETFHTEAGTKEMARALARPITVMGMVENIGKDVGGGPFFIEEKGKRVKVCVEGPHLSPEDIEKLTELAGTEKGATHFNPVYVLREVKRDGKPLPIVMNPEYFIVTERLTGHTSTLHHETVLWEMVGNSGDSNLVFFEMTRGPEGIFNPSKLFTDAMGRDAEELGYSLP